LSAPEIGHPDTATLSPAQSWARALEMTAPIARQPGRILATVIEERADESGEAPALLSDGKCLTYRGLTERANQYARWALEHGIGKGDCVGLFLQSQPEFLALWLGITQVGGVVALLNTNLTGSSLAHCINTAVPRILIGGADMADRLATALPELTIPAHVWSHGDDAASFPRIDREGERYSGGKLDASERRSVTIEDRALYIFTSGTTGLPKAAQVSHGRLMQTSHWFSGMMNIRPADRIYNCLPMYHTVGGVQVPAAVLAGGGSVVIRKRFSASRFWSDVVRWDCTLIQYIGELCRYLLDAQSCPDEVRHRVRMACGNGLGADIWEEFERRFRIPRIFEFYGSTEGNVSLFNIEGERGAVGRIPSYLAHRFPTTLVKLDADTGEPLRNGEGFCVQCGANEAGEAVGRLLYDPANIGSRFEGYTSPKATENKILRDVFLPGDAWFRTGDLMRRDEKGFFYFVDRIGDTFRWKGENVATTEVAGAICRFPGVRQAVVYAVPISGADGKAGMAALVSDGVPDLAGLRMHLIRCLPEYARPLFLRISSTVQITATFKYAKADLARQGYDPGATSDDLYIDDPERHAFVRLDQALYHQIQKGHWNRRRNGADHA